MMIHKKVLLMLILQAAIAPLGAMEIEEDGPSMAEVAESSALLNLPAELLDCILRFVPDYRSSGKIFKSYALAARVHPQFAALISERNLIQAAINEYKKFYNDEAEHDFRAACFCGHYPIVAALIASGVNKETKFSFPLFGWTSLIAAASNNQAKIVELLLEKGVNLFATSSEYHDHLTALDNAIYFAQPEAVEVLINAQLGTFNAVKALRLAISRVSKKEGYRTEGHFDLVVDGRTADDNFSKSFRHRMAKVVEHILAKADKQLIEKMNRKEFLHRSVYTESVKLVKALLNYGLEIDFLNSSNKTAMYLVRKNHLEKMAILLLEYGAKDISPSLFPPKEPCLKERVLRRVASGSINQDRAKEEGFGPDDSDSD